jgi:death-on-curing protein
VKKPPNWISKQAVFAIHETLLAEHGGPPGLLDEGMLDAALASPKNHFAYQHADILRLAAAYAYDLAQNHPFADGNKRVALTVAGVFMELNGFRLDASEQDAANATRALSSREINEVEFADWLRTCSSKLRVARRRTVVKMATKHRKKTKKK